MILIDAERLAASRPNRPLFADVSVTISDGDRLGVVGLNGCGKSTLLRMLAGELRARDRRGAVGPRRPRRLPRCRTRCCRRAPCATPSAASGRARRCSIGWACAAARRADRRAVGRAGQARRAGPPAGRRVRGADPRRADQPPRPRRDPVPRGVAGRVPRRPGAGHPRPPRARQGHHQGARARPRHARTSTCRPAGTRAPATPRTSPAAPSARSAPRPPSRSARTWPTRELAWLRRGAPARTSKPKARIATATALVEGKAQAAARDGELGLSMGSQRLGSKGVELTRRRRSPGPTARRCSIRARWCSSPATGSASSAPTAPASRPCSTSIAGRLAADRRRGRARRHGADRLLRPARPRPRPDPAGARGGRRRQGRAVAGRRRR